MIFGNFARKTNYMALHKKYRKYKKFMELILLILQSSKLVLYIFITPFGVKSPFYDLTNDFW